MAFLAVFIWGGSLEQVYPPASSLVTPRPWDGGGRCLPRKRTFSFFGSINAWLWWVVAPGGGVRYAE